MENQMNIFEQYGGYNAAYDYYKSLSNGATACVVDNTIYSKESLGLLLLEYRRQHNIFEVGDWIVMDSHKPEYQLYQINKDDMGSHWINLVEFRHATPEEIAAGRRL